MKKLLLLPILLLASCKQSTYPFYLNEKYYNEYSIIDLTSIDDFKALEKEKDTIIDNIEKETKALEKEKDARKKYWDDQIDALKKALQ